MGSKRSTIPSGEPKAAFKKRWNVQGPKRAGKRNPGFKAHLEYTISKKNEGRLREFVEKAGLSKSDIILTIAQNASFYGNEDIDCVPDQAAVFSDIKWFLSGSIHKSFHGIGQWIFLKHVLKGKRIRCVAGKNSFYMNPYGKIFPCIFFY